MWPRRLSEPPKATATRMNLRRSTLAFPRHGILQQPSNQRVPPNHLQLQSLGSVLQSSQVMSHPRMSYKQCVGCAELLLILQR